MDDNLDDCLEGNKNGNLPSCNNLQKLFDLRQATLNNLNFLTIKTDYTYCRQDIKSRIDHIYTNTVGKISEVQNVQNMFPTILY